jgi:hypothetical protein
MGEAIGGLVSAARGLKWVARRWLGLVSPPLILAVVVATIPLVPGCSYRKAKTPSSLAQLSPEQRAALAKQAAALRKPSPAAKLTKALADMTGLLKGAEKKLSRGKSAAAEVASLTSMRQGLIQVDREVRSEFANTRKVLAKIHSPAKDRIEAGVEATYAARMKNLASQLALATAAEDTATQVNRMTSLSSWIASVTPAPPHRPLGNQLPNRIVDYHAGPPVLGTAIAPAYAPQTPGAVPSTLPVTPTAEDLTQTVEVQFTEDISKTANELGRDPVKMYEFVRNTIDYEPYYGSRKGANETLWEKAGNDSDQASLLIALYRYSGIPARYVKGVVDIPIAEAMNWVGVDKPEAAAKLFSTAGVPVQEGIAGGRIAKLRIEHWWTEAYVPCESYRGVEAGSGGKNQWAPVDASWKHYGELLPESPMPFSSLDATDVVNQALATATHDSTSCSISGIDTTSLSSAASLLTRGVPTPSTTNPSAFISALVGGRVIRQRRDGLLPSVLGFPEVSPACELSRIPDSFRYFLSVEGQGISFRQSLPSVLGKRLTVSYIPSDDCNHDLVGRYASIDQIPAYLYSTLPILRIDGKVEASGSPVKLGECHSLAVTIDGPVGRRGISASSDLIAGGYYAVAVDAGVVPRSRLSSLNASLASQAEPLRALSTQTYAGDTIEINYGHLLGGLLSLAGNAYFAELDAADSLMARSAGMVIDHGVSCAVSGTQLVTDALLGVPASASSAGLFLDAHLDAAAVDRSDSPGRRAAFLLTRGAMASALESGVWRRLLGSSAVSTADIFRKAGETGARMFTVNRANAAAVLPGLSLQEGTKSEIAKAVNEGLEVIVPDFPYSWGRGRIDGYVIRDTASGSTGWMITGGLGGSSSGGPGALVAEGGLGENAAEVAHIFEMLVNLLLCGVAYIRDTAEVLLERWIVVGGKEMYAAGLAAEGFDMFFILAPSVLVVVEAGICYYRDVVNSSLTEGQKRECLNRIVAYASTFFVTMAAMQGLAAMGPEFAILPLVAGIEGAMIMNVTVPLMVSAMEATNAMNDMGQW